MQVQATTRYIRLSPSKARDLARSLKGLSVAEALKLAEVSARKGARLLGKTLKSAIANATHNAKLNEAALRIHTAVVDEGPRLKRHWPRARGSVSPVLKRTCHMRITLTDGTD